MGEKEFRQEECEGMSVCQRRVGWWGGGSSGGRGGIRKGPGVQDVVDMCRGRDW